MDTIGGFGSGKSVIVLTLVVGCFAVLWPRVFFPMLQTSFQSSSAVEAPTHDVSGTHRASILPCCHPVAFTKELNALYFTELCNQLKWRADRRWADTSALHLPPESVPDVWTPGLPGWCRDELQRSCGVLLDEPALERYRRAAHRRDAADFATRNLTACIEASYGISREDVRPPPRLVREAVAGIPERRGPMHPHPGMRDMPQTPHAALHSMAKQPKRVLDRMARPGPQPGSRPTPGGYGAVPQTLKGTGAMGIIMPLYTIGIIVFFVYTIMKVMFKNPEPEDKEPIVNDFHLSTEVRRFPSQRAAAANGATPRPRTVVVRRPPETPPSARRLVTSTAVSPEDAEIDQLRRRLEETEKAMERIMKQMTTVSEKLNVAKITSNIKSIKQDLWGSTDSVASDSLASERSLSMESLAQTEASIASLEEDVDKAAQAVSSKKGTSDKNGHAANGKKKAPAGLGAADSAGGRRRVQEIQDS